MSTSLHDILVNVPSRGTGTSTIHQYAQQLSTKQAHALFQPTYSNLNHPRNDFISSRLSTKSAPLASISTTFHSDPKITTSLHSNNVPNVDKEGIEKAYLQTIQLNKVGDVKRVSFIDKEAIRWTCGVYSTAATKVFKSPLYDNCDSSNEETDSYLFAVTSKTFHTPQCIMIVCEYAIIFHDYTTRRSSAITTLDFGQTKATPTCAEFISPEICAIGFSDGFIRLWDCLQWKQVKVLNTASKSPVQSLLNLLPKNYFSMSGLGLPIKDGHGRMRLLSVQSDGSALIWECDIFGNMILIGDSDPSGYLSAVSGI